VPAYPTDSLSTIDDLVLRARRRSDHVNSTFVSDAEVEQYVTESYYELYDLMIESSGPEHFLEAHSFSTEGGRQTYPLVTEESTNGVPLDIYKILGVSANIDGRLRPLRRFAVHEIERLNDTPGWSGYGLVRYQFSTNVNKAGDYGGGQYRQVSFTPVPSAAHTVVIYYVPSPVVSVGGGATFRFLHYAHWDEYIVVDAAAKILEKEESDAGHLYGRKEALRQRILWHANTMNHNDAGSVRDICDDYDVTLRGEPFS
jgi:hypothetical protein